MYISRIQIKNFRNFAVLDVPLAKNVVIVGENRVGKSNFIHALRLVLDISLPDVARNLKFSDFWDGCQISEAPEVRVDVDFAEFDSDAALTALLTDYRLPSDYTVARLSYLFERKAIITEPPSSEADYEFKVFGGDDGARSIRPETRRRICMEILHALRDAESDLGSWRSSPLRPLLDDAVSRVPHADLDAIATDIAAATAKLGALEPVQALEMSIRAHMAELAGASQDMKAKLGFAATDAVRLFRSIGLYIDDGKRSINEASLGSANLALLALRLAEFAWRRQKNERNYTVACIEEPEAHLHPHLQRSVFQKLFAAPATEPRSLLLTTHSPHVASVAPLQSIVLLKGTSTNGSKAHSLAQLGLSPTEQEDLQRYLNATRAEILFSRGVIFVEGDAEETLLPVFASSCGHNLDDLGIAVCNVGGVNFMPYVRLALALDFPFAVITDWDPIGPQPPLGRKRALDLIDAVLLARDGHGLEAADRTALEADDTALRETVSAGGVFVNESTLETQIAATADLVAPVLSVLEAEQFGSVRRARLAAWRADPLTVEPEQLLAMVADLGKGRFAGRLAAKAVGLPPPTYIANAIQHVVAYV